MSDVGGGLLCFVLILSVMLMRSDPRIAGVRRRDRLELLGSCRWTSANSTVTIC